MDRRQGYAISHPLSRADGSPEVLRPLMADRRHATGLILRTILAVDR